MRCQGRKPPEEKTGRYLGTLLFREERLTLLLLFIVVVFGYKKGRKNDL